MDCAFVAAQRICRSAAATARNRVSAYDNGDAVAVGCSAELAPALGAKRGVVENREDHDRLQFFNVVIVEIFVWAVEVKGTVAGRGKDKVVRLPKITLGAQNTEFSTDRDSRARSDRRRITACEVRDGAWHAQILRQVLDAKVEDVTGSGSDLRQLLCRSQIDLRPLRSWPSVRWSVWTILA
jgi:hypothetical protein